MATSLRYWKKNFRFIIYTENAFIWFENCKNRAWFVFFLRHKIGCHGNWQRPLRNRKNWTGLTTFTLMPFIWCKNRENWSSRSRNSFAEIKKRKKLRKVKYIAIPASLSSDWAKLYASILYRFRVIVRFSSKVANINPPYLHLSPSIAGDPVRISLWTLASETQVTGLSCGIICVILRLAILIQYRRVTDSHTKIVQELACYKIIIEIINNLLASLVLLSLLWEHDRYPLIGLIGHTN